MSTMQINFYQALIDSLVEYAICLLNTEGNIISWNPGAARTTGYSAREVLGNHYRFLFTDSDRDEGIPERALSDASNQGHAEIEGWRHRKDGTRYWANTIIDTVTLQDGVPPGFAVIARDLTEKKVAEDRLRSSEEQLRLLVQGVGDCAIFMLDREGFITSWNTGAQRIKGYTRDEVLGMHLSTFYSPQDQAKGFPAKGLAIARDVGRYECEGWRVRKDGTSFWAHCILDRIDDDNGHHIGFAKVTRDISAKREADQALTAAREALFQSQKLEAVGQLTGGVAHDFNNLLMAIIGSLELVESRSGDDDVQRHLIGNALAGAKRGAALTRRMLAFARKQNSSQHRST